MISFFGEQCLKDAVVARVLEHQRLDQIIQGTYWDGARGCAIGCVLHSDDHMAYESQLGLPVFLAYMDEYIFERLPVKDAVLWPLRFIEAVPVGVDLDLVFPRFTQWLLSDPHGMRRYADARTLPIIDTLVKMYAGRIAGIQFDISAARSAESAAESARSAARSAECARSAAESVARSARSAAESVARSAESAAESAWSAAWSAAECAGSVALSAEIHRQADYLIMLLRSYHPSPVLVYAPCDERVLSFR